MSEIKMDPEQLKKLADVYQQAEDEAENTLKELKWDTSELMLTLTLTSTGRIRDLQSELNHSIETYRQKVDETQEAVMIARAAIQSADRSMAAHFGVFALELLSYYDIQRINPENEFDPITGEKLSDFDRDLALLMLVLTLAPPAKAVGIAAKMGIKGLKTFLVREGAYLIRSAKNVMNPKVLIEMGKRAFTATRKGPIAKTAQGVKDHIQDMKEIGQTLKYGVPNPEDKLVLQYVGADVAEETAKGKSAKEIMGLIKDGIVSEVKKAKDTIVRFVGKGKNPTKVTPEEIRKVDIDVLDKMEAAGGHTLERHVGKTNEDLIKRAIQQDVEAATSFTDKSTATRAIEDNLRLNADDIAKWINDSSTNRKTFEVSHKSPVGKGALQDKKQVSYDLKDSKMVLIRDDSNENGFRILTSFPVIK